MSKRIVVVGAVLACGLAVAAPRAEAYQIDLFASSNNTIPPDAGPNPASFDFASPVPAATTSGSVAVSGTQLLPGAPFQPSGSASASGNLGTAGVRAASASNGAAVGGGFLTGASAASALIGDRFTLAFTGPTTQVVLLASVRGAASGLSSDPASTADASYLLSATSGAATTTLSYTSAVAGGVTQSVADATGGSVTGSGDDGATFRAVLTVSAADPTIDLSEFLSTDAAGGGSDFLGAVSLFFADGVTVTSESGVFPASVPEPMSVSLLLAAMLGVVGLRLRAGG